MLQAIRSTVGSWVVKILFVLLIISFGVWGIQDVNQGFSNEVAKVGDVKISQGELDRAFRQEVNRLREMVGPEFTLEQARQLGVLEQSTQRLVQTTLLNLAAREQGLRVGDTVVAELVRGIPAFRDAFDAFDPDRMRLILQQNNLNESEFIEQVRSDLAREQLVEAVSGGTVTPEFLATEIFRHRGERRVADTVFVPASTMPTPAAPDDATLTAFHEAHAVRYTAPEYRTFTVASLAPANFVESVTVSDEELREAYEARVTEFVQAETRTLEQAVLNDKAQAEAVVAAVAGGKSLAEAAKAAGVDTVILDSVTPDGLFPELAEPAFSLAQGATSAPLESPLGWHVLTVRAVVPGGASPFEQVREQLLADLRQEKAVDLVIDASNKLDESLARGTPITEAAAEAGAVVVAVRAVDNTGTPKAGGEPPAVQALPDVLKLAFTTPTGETSPTTETSEGGYFAVQVEAIEPATLRPLADARPQVAADWAADQRAAAAKSAADSVATLLRESGDPAAAAAKVPGAVAGRTPELLRTPIQGQDAALPAPVLTDLFAQPANGVVVGETEGGWIVARLAQVIPADPAASAPFVAQIRTAVTGAVSSDLLSQFITGLQSRHPVAVNNAAIAQMYGTEP